MENNQLNITAGTDVLLHVSLEHEGVAIDPTVIESLSATLISGLGKQTALTATVEADYIVVSIPWVEGRLPGCHSLKLAGYINSLAWACVGKSLIKYTSGTEPGASEVTVEGDTYDVTMEVGYHYTDSPINKVTVGVDGGVGTPSADVDYHNLELDFVFHDIKGETGDRGNGIVLIDTVESPDDGGINTVTIITDDDQEGTVFHVKNGHTGKQGDSAVYNPEDPDVPDFVMANWIGDSTTKAMTQKAVTELTTLGFAGAVIGQCLTSNNDHIRVEIVDGITTLTGLTTGSASRAGWSTEHLVPGVNYILRIKGTSVKNPSTEFIALYGLTSLTGTAGPAGGLLKLDEQFDITINYVHQSEYKYLGFVLGQMYGSTVVIEDISISSGILLLDKVADISSSLANDEETLSKIETELYEYKELPTSLNAFITKTGSVTSASVYDCSDYIAVKKGDKIKYHRW